jgi:RimJ/RimL family protein N-acetyltransferase
MMHHNMSRALAEQRQHERRLQAEARRAAAANTPLPTHGGFPAFTSIWAEPTLLDVRPLAGDDSDRLLRLFRRLSPRSIQQRFFSPVRQLSGELLARLVDVDHDQREALVALSHDEIIAVALYAGAASPSRAELAVTVEDTWQQRGIGKRLTFRLSELAVERGFDMFVARIMPDNQPALRLARALSRDTVIRMQHGEYEASIPLVAR